MHTFPTLPQGWFATRVGPLMAAFDVFEVNIKGSGGHAAMPHNTKDPILAASHMISQFQGIISRNLDPIETGVVSVTDIHGGTTFNVIPEELYLRGTTRHFQPYVQDMIESRMGEIVKGVAIAAGVKAELKYDRRYPPTVNSEKETLTAIKAAGRIDGSDKVLTDIPPVMGSEDFAFMLQNKPGNYMVIGAGESRPGGLPHQSGYDFNDEILPIGVAYWQSLAQVLLP
jgi:amidohydrolase